MMALEQLSRQLHIERHRELHKALDELAADYIFHTGNLPNQTTVMDLMRWSHTQTINPDEGEKSEARDGTV